MTVAELLEFEQAHVSDRAARKEEAVRKRFGISLPAYLQALHAAVRSREGIEHDPVLARIIRERIEHRTAARAALLARSRHPVPGAAVSGRSTEGGGLHG